MEEHQKPWNSLSIEEVYSLFQGASFPWWIAGGLAIELAVGRTIRSHGDIDVLVLRRDQGLVRNILADWDCWAADPPGHLRPWGVKETLSFGVQDIWCRKTENDSWQLQLMIDESDENGWVSRKDPNIKLSINEITHVTVSSIPYLAPHVILFYTAKNPEGKHQIDFDALIQNKVPFDRTWLLQSVSNFYGSSHPWVKQLELG